VLVYSSCVYSCFFEKLLLHVLSTASLNIILSIYCILCLFLYVDICFVYEEIAQNTEYLNAIY